MKNAIRPAIFKWRQTAPELILCAVRWYLRYSLSLREVEELFAERGLEADHTTIWSWVQRYGPELEQRLRRHLKPTNKSWRVDETYIRVKGAWCYLYRAIDSTGATIDFLLSALRDAAAAERLFRKALSDSSHPQPRVINTDKARLYHYSYSAATSFSHRRAPGGRPSLPIRLQPPGKSRGSSSNAIAPRAPRRSWSAPHAPPDRRALPSPRSRSDAISFKLAANRRCASKLESDPHFDLEFGLPVMNSTADLADLDYSMFRVFGSPCRPRC